MVVCWGEIYFSPFWSLSQIQSWISIFPIRSKLGPEKSIFEFHIKLRALRQKRRLLPIHSFHPAKIENIFYFSPNSTEHLSTSPTLIRKLRCNWLALDRKGKELSSRINDNIYSRISIKCVSETIMGPQQRAADRFMLITNVLWRSTNQFCTTCFLLATDKPI